MIIGSIGDIGFSTYVVTRVSARQGETPSVDSVDSVDSPQQNSEEISWLQAMSLFASPGAVVQRLSILSGRGSSSSWVTVNSEMDEEMSRRAAEYAGSIRLSQQNETQDTSENLPMSDPISRWIDEISERAKAIVSTQQGSGERMALLGEMLQQFRSDIRQAAQSYDPRSTRREEFFDRVSEAMDRLSRSFESDREQDHASEYSTNVVEVEDALTDSPIPPETLRAAFAAEAANLRMTLSELDQSGQNRSRPTVENLQIEQYLSIERERIERQSVNPYHPQLNAVA